MKPRVGSVTTVPTARPQRTPPPTNIDEAWPKDAKGWHNTPDHKVGLHIPGTLGRFPTVGIDPGAIPGSRPDQSSITKRTN